MFWNEDHKMFQANATQKKRQICAPGMICQHFMRVIGVPFKCELRFLQCSYVPNFACIFSAIDSLCYVKIDFIVYINT